MPPRCPRGARWIGGQAQSGYRFGRSGHPRTAGGWRMTMLQQDGSPIRAPAPESGLHALIDVLPVPALLLAPCETEPVVAGANAAFLALSGFSQSDIVGRDLGALQSRHGDPTVWAKLRQAVAAGGHAQAELLCARKDGTSFWGELFAVPLLEGGRSADGHIVQIVDVTRRRDAEDGLKLSQQREALGLLTNSVAHEFNNFLQILIGYIDSLKRRLGDRPEPPIQRALTRSTEAAERAAVLTRQLLTYSRRIAPEVRPVDLAALVTRVGDTVRETLPERVSLDVQAAPGLPPALCNPAQVEVALRYLVVNAVEASEQHGRLEVATFAVAPGDRSLQRPGDGAVGITVRDTGHGMSPEMVTRALVPFATSREAGRGVGLAIVHGLMKRQNGTISLESRPGEGTTVRLVFPAAA